MRDSSGEPGHRPAADSACAVAAIVVAAGTGERLGAGRPKALVEVGGRPLLGWALDGLRAAGIDHIVVVAHPEYLDQVAAIAGSASVVPGGATRQESVSAGLAQLTDEPGIVLVHDAARCLTPPDTIELVIRTLQQGARVVIPAIPIVDTLRARTGGVVDRSHLVSVQTPQGFHRDVLEQAHHRGAPGATDDALLAEANGEHVTLVPGSDEAFKVTTPLDLVLAEALVRHRADGAARPAAADGRATGSDIGSVPGASTELGTGSHAAKAAEAADGPDAQAVVGS
ncbi:MAG: 2-C-methyl-D-erythritol 4-phosphate cytidylyltransferase [Actinomycetales bacterium]